MVGSQPCDFAKMLDALLHSGNMGLKGFDVAAIYALHFPLKGNSTAGNSHSSVNLDCAYAGMNQVIRRSCTRNLIKETHKPLILGLRVLQCPER